MRVLLLLLLCLPAEAARSAKKPSRDPRTAGLGHSCQKSTDCKHKSQRCLREMDANGKETARGFCVLPCKSFEAGITPVKPGFPATDAKVTEKVLKTPPPPRCPPKYLCRTAGSGVPIDMCVQQ
jgi:hypothetical protein